MINKEKFIEIINRLKEADEIVNKVNEILRNTRESIENDFMNASAMSISHETVVVELLENMFDTDMISYWCWELDYGTNYKHGYVLDADNKIIDLSTPEKLYDFLIIDMSEKENKE